MVASPGRPYGMPSGLTEPSGFHGATPNCAVYKNWADMNIYKSTQGWFGASNCADAGQMEQTNRVLTKMEKSLKIISNHLSNASNSQTKKEAIEHVESAETELEQAKELERERAENKKALEKKMTDVHEMSENDREILRRAENDVEKKLAEQLQQNKTATEFPEDGDKNATEENDDESDEKTQKSIGENEDNCYLVRL